MPTLGQLIGTDLIEDFNNWDFSEVEKVLQQLAMAEVPDLSHAELLQQQALRGADIISEYLSKMVKTVSYLESKLNSVKNRAALDFKPEEGQKATADMRKQFGESAPEVDQLSAQLARSKGAKVLLEKKFDLIIRAHYQYKEVAAGLRRTILGQPNGSTSSEWG